MRNAGRGRGPYTFFTKQQFQQVKGSHPGLTWWMDDIAAGRSTIGWHRSLAEWD